MNPCVTKKKYHNVKGKNQALEERNEELESKYESNLKENRNLRRKLNDQEKQQQSKDHKIAELERIINDKTKLQEELCKENAMEHDKASKEDLRAINLALHEDRITNHKRFLEFKSRMEKDRESSITEKNQLSQDMQQKQALHQKEVAQLMHQIASEKGMAAQQTVMMTQKDQLIQEMRQKQDIHHREVAQLRDQIESEKQMAAEQLVMMRNHSETQLNAQRVLIDELEWEHTECNKEWQTSYDQLVMIAVIGCVVGVVLLVMVIVFGIKGCRLRRKRLAFVSKIVNDQASVFPEELVISEVLEDGARLQGPRVLDKDRRDFDRAKRINMSPSELFGDRINREIKDHLPERIDSFCSDKSRVEVEDLMDYM